MGSAWNERVELGKRIQLDEFVNASLPIVCQDASTQYR